MAIKRTYCRVEEDPNSPDDNNPDGRAIYRALARQILGDPQNFNYILNEVLHHYLRAWLNRNHPLHQRYHDYNREENFYSNLSKPGNSGSWDKLHPVLTVASNALRTEIIIEKPDGTEQTIGADLSDHMQCRILEQQRNQEMIYSSPILEDTGQDLINYMSAFKAQSQQLDIREIKWWWDSANPNPTKFYSANEFEPSTGSNTNLAPPIVGQPWQDESKNSIFPAIFSNFVVSVKKPEHIAPALDLLFNILPLSPGQKIPVNSSKSLSSGLKSRLLHYVGIDAEFKLVSTSISEEHLEMMQSDDSASAETLCTVLSIAVDRHVTFFFYILDMLENPCEDKASGVNTVSGLEDLWRRVIFNENLLKIWFNFQSDISTLDNTIAHLYQLTERKPYKHPKTRAELRPSFRLSNPLFVNKRPTDLFFPTKRVDCQFHTNGPTQQGSRDMFCPCRHGNLELETILAHVCKQIGLTYEPKREWYLERKGFSYAWLLQQFLEGDWIFPLLNYLKGAPNRWARQKGVPQGRFYRSLGPPLEDSSDAMGYNIGDVVGIALMFRFLTTTDDRKLLFERLRKVSFSNSSRQTLIRRVPQTPFDDQTKSANDSGIPLISDNPRGWSADLNNLWDEEEEKGDFPTALWIERNANLVERDNSFMAHEKLIETRCGLDQSLSEWEQRYQVKKRLYDPCRFELAEGMTRKLRVSDHHKPATVQVMETHIEDIFWRARAYKASESNIPKSLLRDCEGMDGYRVSHGVQMAVNGPEMSTRWTEQRKTIENYLPTAIKRVEAGVDVYDDGQLLSTSPPDVISNLVGLKRHLLGVLWSGRAKPDSWDDKFGVKFFDRVDSEDTPQFEKEAILSNSEQTTTVLMLTWFNTINARIREIMEEMDPEEAATIRYALNEPDPWPPSSRTPSPTRTLWEEFPKPIHRSDRKAGSSRASHMVARPNVVTRSMARLASKRPASSETPNTAKRRKNG